MIDGASMTRKNERSAGLALVALIRRCGADSSGRLLGRFGWLFLGHGISTFGLLGRFHRLERVTARLALVPADSPPRAGYAGILRTAGRTADDVVDHLTLVRIASRANLGCCQLDRRCKHLAAVGAPPPLDELPPADHRVQRNGLLATTLHTGRIGASV